jgi:hypothetical protein
VTDAFVARRPAAPVTHQSNGYVNDWQFGVSDDSARLTAWLTADLYRDKRDLAFSFKLFNALSEQRPFEMISGWTWPDIFEHSVLRTAAELEETAVLALANDAAIMFIDQIDPVGTIAEAQFDLAAPIMKRIEAVEPLLGGELVQDVGIYVSFDASFDRRQNGQRVADLGFSTEPANPKSGPTAHRAAAIVAGETLARRHIPFGVVTRRHLERLADWRVIVLPNVGLLSAAEVEAFRAYVAAGGRLYASGATSLLGADGLGERLRLGDVLGVTWLGETAESLTYAAPPAGERLGVFTLDRPMTIHDRSSLVQITAGSASVRAAVALPYTDPAGIAYSSLLTDPPGRWTSHPAIVENAYGRGRAVYAAAPIEAERHESQRKVFADLVVELAGRPFSFECDAPPCVEVTMFRQRAGARLVVHFVNVQADAPPVPISGARLFMPAATPVADVRAEPGASPTRWREENGRIAIDVPTFGASQILRVELEPTK